MHGALQTVEDADAARRHLHAEIDAVGVEALGLFEDAQPLVGREVALHQRDRAGPRARARERLDESELGRELVALAFEIEIVDDLENAAAPSLQDRCKGDQLLAGGFGGGRPVAVCGAVNVGAPDREARRAGVERVPQKRLHEFEIVFVRLLAEGRALAHGVDADRVVHGHGGEVDGVRHGVEAIEILAETLPAPAYPLVKRGSGDVLDALHQADEAVMVLSAHRREADAAIAHEHGRDAEIHRRAQLLVPRNLPVIMRVQVDEAGRHDRPFGVDDAVRMGRAAADFRDAPILDADIGAHGRAAVAVMKEAVGDLQIKCHSL